MADEKRRRLAAYVHVAGKRYGPDDDIPDEVAARITNPKAWAVPTDDDDSEPSEVKAVKGGTSYGARLAAYVHVAGKRYGPDDDIPDEVAARITNPKAWEGGRLPNLPAADRAPEQTGSSEAGTPPAGPSEDKAPADTTSPPAGPVDVPAPPPRSGRGSGVDAWAAWASARGVAVAEGANREDIIAACEQARVIEAESK